MEQIELSGFDGMFNEDNSVDTDLGTLRDISFMILFKDKELLIGEDDFSKMVNAFIPYCRIRVAEQIQGIEMNIFYLEENKPKNWKKDKEELIKQKEDLRRF